jgi:hypothetical protein
MTAQIRPNRMEVSDRFPMLGFSVRVDEPNVEAEVVLANDISLFSGENRTKRTPGNFYSSRENGTLMVPRGDGVFVVAPEVLARFVGSDKLYFGLATGHANNGGLMVDAFPRDGSPYVSLRGFTGRTLRRSGWARNRAVPPRLEWTGDAPKPGSESSAPAAATPARRNGANGTNGADRAVPASAPGASGAYDDGFGPMPAIPARQSAYRGAAAMAAPSRMGIMLSSGTTARDALDWIMRKVEQGVAAVGSDVSPPSLYRLGSNSSTFISAWETGFGLTSLFAPTNAFLAAIPALARETGVTLSIGPALDTPVFGGGVGVVFAPNGQVALFGSAEISVDFSGLSEFVSSLKVALQAKMKLGYNNGGIDGFASLAKVASLNVGEEIVVGAELWLNGSGQGLGGAVSIGVGMALQLASQQRGHGRAMAAQPRVGIMLSSGTTARDALDWIRHKVEQGVAAAGSDVSPPSLYRLGDNSSTFISAWETGFGITSFIAPANAFLAALPALARETGVTLSVGPALDTPVFGGGVGVVFAPNGQVALFGSAEISVDFAGLSEFVSSLKLALQAKMKLGYNNGGIDGFASLAKVASVNVGEEIVVGAELWLNGSGQGLGGAVSIGVGLALQLAADPRRRRATAMSVPPSRTAIMLSSGTSARDALNWIMRKVEQGVAAVGSDVSPPSLYRLGDNSSTFISAWEAGFGLTSFIAPTNAFLAAIPALARETGVTLSIGPALDTPVFGGGVGVVFAPNGQVALFGSAEISADFAGLSEFVSSLKVALQAKMKLGYNNGGIDGFASLAKVASLNVGEEIVVGAELWLNGSGQGLGGAVSIGVGLALQLAADQQRRAQAMTVSPRTAIMLSSGTTAQDALNWIMRKVEQGVAAVGSDVSPPSLYRLGGNSSTFISAWETVLGVTSFLNPGNAFLAALPGLARDTGVTLSIGPALDTPVFGGGVGVVFGPDGQVALFGSGEISVDLSGLSDFVSSLKLALQAKMKLGYNRGGINGFASLAKVASINVGEEIVVGAELWLDGSGSGIGGAVSIGVGLALQLAQEPPQTAIVRPVLPNDQRGRATRIGGAFAGRIHEALDLGLEPRSLDPLLDTLDPPARAIPMARPMNAVRRPSRPIARAQAATRSINWDDVELIPQPTNQTCWAAAAAMVIGWRDQVSLSPETVASICSRSTIRGLSPYDRVTFAAQIGLETEPPQSYAVEGYYNLLTSCGPLWVSKIAGGGGGTGGHAVVVTGMYSEGDQHYVRIADPWDRIVGTPGTPGNYAATHNTGSRYIMRYEDFQTEYELRIVGNPPTPQILHSGGTAGRIPNTGTTSAPAGYAMAAPPPNRGRRTTRTRARAQDAGAIATVAGTIVTLIAGNTGDIAWQLPQWTGHKHPNDVAPANEAPYQQAVIELNDWPSASGCYAHCLIRWHYNGTSIGPVYVERGTYNDTVGWGVLVTGTIEDDPRLHPRGPMAGVPGPAQVPALHVALTWEFHAPILTDDPTATTRVTLYADGTHEVDSAWTQHSGEIFEQYTQPEPHDKPRALAAVPAR